MDIIWTVVVLVQENPSSQDIGSLDSLAASPLRGEFSPCHVSSSNLT